MYIYIYIDIIYMFVHRTAYGVILPLEAYVQEVDEKISGTRNRKYGTPLFYTHTHTYIHNTHTHIHTHTAIGTYVPG